MAAIATPFNQTKSLESEVALLQAITGYWVSKAIYVAAELNIADRLSAEPRSAAELANETQTHAPSLYRVLRALAGEGIFAEDADGRFRHTPLSQLLKSGPGSLRHLALHMLETPTWIAWDDLMESVRTGDAAFPRVNSLEVFPYYAEHAESAKPFDRAMSESSQVLSTAVTAAYDFSPFRHIVDVGGGHGELLKAVLDDAPDAYGVLYDQSHVIEGARADIEGGPFGDRCTLAAGDFFENVPEGDAHLLKFILHDWDDDRARMILRNIRRSMKPGGKLLIVESIVPVGNEPHFSKGMDVHMLIMTGGRERTIPEYRELLASSGFRLTRVVPTDSPVSIIEAVKAEIR
jgi:SAM-dependent methyltransferase